MTKPMQMLALAAVFGLVVSAAARAQDKSSQPVTPLKVQVVIARHQGEKKISSLPYTLSVNANAAGASANLRMGAKIPVVDSRSRNAVAPDGKPTGPCDQLSGRRHEYRLLSPQRSTMAASVCRSPWTIRRCIQRTIGKPGGSSGHPAIRSFRAINSMVLKDGQTAQFTAATDKLTGETVRVDVTLTGGAMTRRRLSLRSSGH